MNFFEFLDKRMSFIERFISDDPASSWLFGMTIMLPTLLGCGLLLLKLFGKI